MTKEQRAKRNTYAREYHSVYDKTPFGYLTRKYHSMQSRVRGHNRQHLQYKGMDILPREKFYDWAINNSEYQRLFAIWKKSGYELKFAPTPDRIDNAKGYLLSNLRWVDYSTNTRLGIHYNKLKRQGAVHA